MTRLERCELAIKKGYTYNAENGNIYNKHQKEITGKFNTGYIKIQLRVNNKNYHLKGHIFGWYCVYKECVVMLDHINGIRYDNRISNLRGVTCQQNQWNQQKAKGYHWNKSAKKWHSQIVLNRNKIYLGCFNTEEEARQAYLNAKQIYHVI
jgi:hypothetical protein